MSKFQLTVHFESAADLYAFASVLPGAHTSPVSADDIVRAFGGIVPPKPAAPVALLTQCEAVVPKVIAPEDNPSAGLPSPTEMVASTGAAAVTTPTPPASLDTAAIFGKVPSAAPLAPAPAAPAAPTPPTAATAPIAAPAVELDSKGLPWDGRIHSETRNKIADGSWRKRRGVADELVQSVEAQLRALLGANAAAAPAATVTATTLPVAAEPPAPPVVTAPAAHAAPITPLPPAAPVAAPPAPPTHAPATAPAPTASPSSPAAGAQAGANPVGDFMLKSAELMAAGKLTMARVTEVCQKHGLANLAQLVMAPNLLPAIEAELLA